MRALILVILIILSQIRSASAFDADCTFRANDSIVNDAIRASFDLNDMPAHKAVVIRWETGVDGRIYKPSILKSSGDPVVDCCALEAVCSNSPESSNQKNRKGSDARCCLFDASCLVPSSPRAKRREVLSTSPVLQLYLIPLSFSQLYPNIFSRKDLHVRSNLRIIGDSNRSVLDEIQNKIIAVMDEWATFRLREKKPTRKSITEFSSHLEQKYKLRREQ